MKFTKKSQQSPPPSLPWYAYPDDTEAMTRVYGQQALTLGYDYPVYAISAGGELVQDSNHANARYQPYKIQFNLLCDKLLSLATENGLNTDINENALTKFRKDLLCAYHGDSKSKYAQQDNQTFEEVKYNLEVILNHIIKNEDIKTLKDVLEALAVCEGGFYLESRRLKAWLTEVDGLQEFLQQQRINFAEAIAQKHIELSTRQGFPIDEIAQTHLSNIVVCVLRLLGESLPAVNLRDNYIPRIVIDPVNSDNLLFASSGAAETASDVYQINHERMMSFVEQYRKLNTPINMHRILAQHLNDKIFALYLNYRQKLEHGISNSDESKRAAGIALLSGISAVFFKFKINHLCIDSFLHYDEFDMSKPMILKSRVERLYYFHAASALALQFEGMTEGMVEHDLQANAILKTDGLKCWVTTTSEAGSGVIHALDTIPLLTVARLFSMEVLDIRVYQILKEMYRQHDEMGTRFEIKYSALKQGHNEKELRNEGVDFILEQPHDGINLQWKINYLPTDRLTALIYRMVKNNRPDVLILCPFEKYSHVSNDHLFLLQLLKHAIKHGYDEIADILINKAKAPLSPMPECPESPLSIAINYTRPAILSMLLATQRCNLEERYEPSGMTPIMRALFLDEKEIAVLLLKAGADITTKDNANLKAYDYAENVSLKALIMHFDKEYGGLGTMAAEGEVNIDFIQLMSHPKIHKIAERYGLKDLCLCANLDFSSESTLKVYARIQILIHIDESQGRLNENTMNAYNAVINAPPGDVATALSSALRLTRPLYTRVFLSPSYTPSDMPAELSDRLRQ